MSDVRLEAALVQCVQDTVDGFAGALLVVVTGERVLGCVEHVVGVFAAVCIGIVAQDVGHRHRRCVAHSA